MRDIIKVLVIDDDKKIRELLEYNLTFDGFDVELAKNGVEGLKMIRRFKPQLILLDIMMPEMDGYEVLEIISRDDWMSHIPVFMLTAKGMLGDVERAFKLGAADYITKPFDPFTLGEIIRKKFNRRMAA
ncbi:MAG: PleD family two-component system response regulator [Candidatus Zixiibacteriota bacterium]